MTNPLRHYADGRRMYKCGRCGELMPEDKQFERSQPRNLYLDIEVGKARVYTFDLHVRSEYIQHTNIDKERYIICWSAGWIGERGKIMSACVSPSAARKYSDAKILPPLLKLMEQADIISGHNVDRYDIPMINARMVINGMTPVFGYKTMDSLKMARKDYRFMSNTLDALAPMFGFRPKQAMSDKDWLAIADHGDEKTLVKMERYNKGDVRNGMGVLESLLKLNGKPIEDYMRTFKSEPRDKREHK